jgi:hypothetical protein
MEFCCLPGQGGGPGHGRGGLQRQHGSIQSSWSRALRAWCSRSRRWTSMDWDRRMNPPVPLDRPLVLSIGPAHQCHVPPRSMGWPPHRSPGTCTSISPVSPPLPPPPADHGRPRPAVKHTTPTTGRHRSSSPGHLITRAASALDPGRGGSRVALGYRDRWPQPRCTPRFNNGRGHAGKFFPPSRRVLGSEGNSLIPAW